MKELRSTVEKRIPGGKLIEITGNPRAVIIKTDVQGMQRLRSGNLVLGVGGIPLVPELTSGAVGNLKRRARGTAANGKVPE